MMQSTRHRIFFSDSKKYAVNPLF